MRSVKKIVNNNLCLGCGICESIAPKKCKMVVNEQGFYLPKFNSNLSRSEEKSILKICPAINISDSNESKTVWGKLLEIKEAWSTDSVVRHKGSSGGVISTLGIYLLEKKLVDGVLHVGLEKGSYIKNKLKISRTREEIIGNSGSRYAPALVFSEIKQVLESSQDKFAFIGKPCDIIGINNLINNYPEIKDKITYKVAFFCGGMPSYNATEKLIKASPYKEEPVNVRYRGNGWPGFFTTTFKSGNEHKVSYHESWGKTLGKELCFRCKICPDGIGLSADLSVGDSWDSMDGYPTFEEKDGRSFVLVRTKRGKEIFSGATRDKYLNHKDYRLSNLNNVQKYQYERRVYAPYRILPVQLRTFFLIRIKRLGFLNIVLKGRLKTGVGNMLGTIKRMKF